MSALTTEELAYLLGERRLGRLATVGADGTPHVAPVGWTYDRAEDVIEIGGRDVGSTKKFRDVRTTGRAAIVIDDIASVQPWHVRGVEIRGRAEALSEPRPVIRLHAERVVSWGLTDAGVGARSSRRVDAG